MDRKLKQELVFLTAFGALGAWFFGSHKIATGLTVAAGGLALYPTPAVSFRNRVVVITGGSRGLGLALATELARQGARLALLARDSRELVKAREQLSTWTNHVLALSCDVTQRKDLELALQKVQYVYGQIDVLINNAGAILVTPFQCANPDDYQAQLDLHFFAPLNAITLALPLLKKSPIGRIVNICSMGGKVAVPHMLPYDVSKFALAGFSQGITYELAQENIPVTTVYPALLRTGSPIQAVFKGHHEKEFAWFAASDVMPGLSWSAQRAAREIVKACSVGQREVILSSLGYIRQMAAGFFPELMGEFFSLLNRLLPHGKSTRYKTGAQSRRLFDRAPSLGLLRERAHEAEELWNQHPKPDAKSSIGLH